MHIIARLEAPQVGTSVTVLGSSRQASLRAAERDRVLTSGSPTPGDCSWQEETR